MSATIISGVIVWPPTFVISAWLAWWGWKWLDSYDHRGGGTLLIAMPASVISAFEAAYCIARLFGAHA